ncbi:hypothetical protein [Paracidovorax avenae]|uniref:hypothetical protein n=1 Tax=Paracidovorax avenae TaxID=80867 RepID=UPI001AD8282A|nr:hypothetical protein [Paracidovorax avenae]
MKSKIIKSFTSARAMRAHAMLPVSGPVVATCVALAAFALAGCKQPPEPTCEETVQVFERNGQRAFQTVNGIYLKANLPFSGCGNKRENNGSGKNKYVRLIFESFYWHNNKLSDMKEYSQLLKRGEWPKDPPPLVKIIIDFDRQNASTKRDPGKDWWYQPAIPHKLYPIDLLPNFALESPDPEAGIGRIKSKPKAYWAVRGTLNSLTRNPYLTFCSMKSPPERDPRDYSEDATKERDPSWLIQAMTYEEDFVGNTCRGYVSASNGQPIAAMIDVPGAAVKDIDRIYTAMAEKISAMTVE